MELGFRPRKSARSLLALLLILPASTRSQETSGFLFMEPVPERADEVLPVYRPVTEPSRVAKLDAWTGSDWSLWALDLYRRARTVAAAAGLPVPQPETYPVALVPGGNHAALGFVLAGPEGDERMDRVAYIKLDEAEYRFNSTILHETGHVVLKILAGGRELPVEPMAAVPHTTPALTDRCTAFNEGFAIHLETLFVHLSEDQWVRDRYRHGQLLFGRQPGVLSEYHRVPGDLLTFAQSLARYPSVRDNEFSFCSAFYREADYVRVQLDPARDRSRLRSANQLLQSEGWYASFFFGLHARGTTIPNLEAVRTRVDRTLEVLTGVLSGDLAPDTPYVNTFLEQWHSKHPDDFGEVADVFLDSSRGAFLDPEAAGLWRQFYDAALRLDLQGWGRERIAEKRAAWRETLSADPASARRLLGPQLPVEVNGPVVFLVAFGEEIPLTFDLNTVQPGILRLIPAVTETEVERWLSERAQHPFGSYEDFLERAAPGPSVRAVLEFGPLVP